MNLLLGGGDSLPPSVFAIDLMSSPVFLMFYWRTNILEVLLGMDFFRCVGNGVLVVFYEGVYSFYPYRCQ